MSTISSYYCQNTDARYLPGVLYSVNDLAESATKHRMKLFKDSRMFCCTTMNHLVLCTIAIRTSTYSMSHIDKSDKLTTAVKTELLSR